MKYKVALILTITAETAAEADLIQHRILELANMKGVEGRVVVLERPDQ